MAVRHYNQAEILMILGEIIVEGIAQGTHVEIEPVADATSLYVGGDGKGTRSMSNNRAALIRITLSQSSKTNELFSALLEADRANGSGVRPFMLKDLNGTTLHTAATAWIKRQPNVGFGSEVGTRQWTIETDDLRGLFGSAGDPP